MEKNELLKRIEKKENDIKKIEKRIIKWSTGMNPNAHSIIKTAAYENIDTPAHSQHYKEYRDYIAANGDNSDVNNPDDWNKGPSSSELYSAYRDLYDAEKTLANYKVQLDKKNNFDNMTKIKVIWDFLQDWKERAKMSIIQQGKLLYELKQKEDEKFKQWFLQNFPGKDINKESWRTRALFMKKYYSVINSVVFNLYKSKGELDLIRLDKLLDAEVEKKYKDLISRITAKAGEIVDASDLKIVAGNINGTVIGSNRTVEVETIGAGGYNVQIFHYRTLVK